MFIFTIKDNRMAMDVAIIRALLALAAIASIIYRTPNSFLINISAAVILFLLSVFSKAILVRFSIRPFLLAVLSAILFFIATHAFIFALLLLMAAVLPAFFYKPPVVEVGEDIIVVKRMIGSSAYDWEKFSNIILKDNLLTLDFKNNKVLQLEVDEKTAIDEKKFNGFCAGKIMQ